MSELAGMLRERVTIEQAVTMRNAMGLQEPGWDTLCQCRAAVALDSVGAESEAQALSAMPRYRLTIRRREGVAIDQRVRWKSRALMIRQLLDDPRLPDRLVLRCEEVRG